MPNKPTKDQTIEKPVDAVQEEQEGGDDEDGDDARFMIRERGGGSGFLRHCGSWIYRDDGIWAMIGSIDTEERSQVIKKTDIDVENGLVISNVMGWCSV